MIWVRSSPSLLLPIDPIHLPILQILHVPHTPLVALLTATTILIYDQHSLLEVACHARSTQSIESYGHNVAIKCKHVSINTSQLQKLPTVKLYIQTGSDYLIIYQVFINYNNSLYEVFSSKSDQLIQNSAPLSDTRNKFSLSNIFKTATQTIMSGSHSSHINLENVEHFNNDSIEDDCVNSTIEFVKLSTFKVLKVSIGVKNFWLKSNSHNLIIFNDKCEVQLVNMENFDNVVIKLKNLDWFDESWVIKCIEYNIFQNYFIFINNKGDVYVLNIKIDEDLGNTFEGEKTYSLPKEEKYIIEYNPNSPLVLLGAASHLTLFKLYFDSQHRPRLVFIKEITTGSRSVNRVMWSPCGTYFATIDTGGYWSLYSKFGNHLFDSKLILDEISDPKAALCSFMTCSQLVIGPNSNQIYVLNRNLLHLYLADLIQLFQSNDDLKMPLISHQYLSIPQANNELIRFPLQPRFRNILNNLEILNGLSTLNSPKSVDGYLKIGYNKFNQFSMSFGDTVSISTPTTDGHNVNHILWFNFQNYYMESLNVVNHFWYDDNLILINRFSKEENVFVDELIVLDTAASKYGHGGSVEFKFDSDTIIWRHNFHNRILSYELSESPKKDTKVLVLMCDDCKIINVELSKDYTHPETKKFYKTFIGINKTIHLSSIKHRLPVLHIEQVRIVDGRHFLFLLNQGDVFLLKNQSGVENGGLSEGLNSNMYDLIKIAESVEYLKVKAFSNLGNNLMLFDGSSVIVHNLPEMIEKAFDNSKFEKNSDVDLDTSSLLSNTNMDSISIDVSDYYPLDLTGQTSKSLDLIGLEIANAVKNGILTFKERLNQRLVLNYFIEYDLYVSKLPSEAIIGKYRDFKNFSYCIELILFKYLTQENKPADLKKIIKLIEDVDSPFAFINCLRKIEVKYWVKFFDNLGRSPKEFMNQLITRNDEELCYSFLIVYLNFKKEFAGDEEHEDHELVSPSPYPELLESEDHDIILQIIQMLAKADKYDLCYELCRFIKLLEPNNKFLTKVKASLQEELQPSE